MTDLEVYNRLEPDQVKSLLKQINPVLEGVEYPAEDTTILEKNLDFYKGYTLLDVSNHALIPVPHRYVLRHKKNIIPLDFTNQAIYALNQTSDFQLTKASIASYIKFFFEFVRGPKGFLQLVESLDDIDFLEELSTQERHTMAAKVLTLDEITHQKGKSFTIKASFVFKTALIHAIIDVNQDNGHVTLSDEIVKESNLVVKQAFMG